MTSSDLIHESLFQALLEIRESASISGDKVSFHLAHLFHTVVARMKMAAAGETTYDDVLDALRDFARERGLEDWLKKQEQRLAKRESELALGSATP